MKATIALTWPQVSAWRLSRHALLERAGPGELLEVVRRTGGIQAQLLPAAELALWARVEGLSPDAVQRALWEERTLVKTWAMRGTLHLLVAEDLPLYVAARATPPIRRPPSYYTYHGVTPEELEAIQKAIPAVLGETPLTREQLAGAIAEWAGAPNLRQVLLSGWGALLKPSAFRGDLCFGPSQGQNVTFVRPDRWVPSGPGGGEPGSLDAQEALQAMARRYLDAFGPATPDDFARWWALPAGPAKKVFKSFGDELVAVDVEGWQAWALASTVKPLQKLDAPRSTRLLPQFDALTVGVSRDCDYFLAAEYRPRVYRPQGWISAVVLVDGRVEGVWEYDRQTAQTAVRVTMFQPPSRQVESAIEAEAKKLGEFLGSEIELVID